MKFKFEGNITENSTVYGFDLDEKGIVDIPKEETKIITKLEANSHFSKVKPGKPAVKAEKETSNGENKA